MKSITALPYSVLRSNGLLPGLILAGAIALTSIGLAQLVWCQAHGVSALTLAILLGMVAGNTVYDRIGAQAAAGVDFSKTRLLRLGIVLFGLRLTLHDIAAIGLTGIATDVLVLCTTFGLACWTGTRLFGLDRQTAMLIGAGSSICGAAAVMAAAPVVRGRPEQVMVAVATVVVFGTLSMFLYPLAYHALMQAGWIHLSPAAYGVFAGSTIHEVAQVVVAGRAVGEAAGDTAVITKMVRVMMLAPFLLALSAWLARRPLDGAGSAPADGGGRITIPWFALGFIAVAAFNSLDVLPPPVVSAALDIDTLLLAMAMAALGLGTRVSSVRRAGVRPLGLAALLLTWLVLGGYAINLGVAALAG